MAAPAMEREQKTAFGVLLAISFCHLLNDLNQSLFSAIYPILKSRFHLGFAQIGLLTLTFQAAASLLQPVVGMYTDKRPTPYSLPIGMCFTLVGLLVLAAAPTYGILLVAAGLVGLGSAIFHPESSRVARLASGGQHGLAQSIFQVGGTGGASLGPLLAAFIVVPQGQSSVAWFSVVALLGIFVTWKVGVWYKAHLAAKPKRDSRHAQTNLPARRVAGLLAILLVLIFSKYFYLASIQSYYMFYLMGKFHLSLKTAQIFLFMFLASAAVGTLLGGPIGDRIGRRAVIRGSILGVLPFTLLLPHANLLWTAVLTVVIGFILASAFSAILVYAQELVPGRTGAVSGLFFGFAFGMAGVGAAVLGKLADATSINFVYQVCAYLPAIGLLAMFLPASDPHPAYD